MPRKYFIDFDTKDMPGRIKAVTVELGTYVVRDNKEKMAIDLVDHPLYPKLERYVLANMGRGRSTK